MNELTIKKEVEIEGLTKAKRKLIIEKYSEPIKKINEIAQTFPEIKAMEMSPEKVAKAKRFRIDFNKSVKAVENVKKELKEESLKEGRAIQGVFNYVKEKTAELKNEALEIENYYIKIEEEKKKRIQAERENELQKYNVDGSTMDLAGMIDAVWLNLIAGSRATFEAEKKAAEDAEKERREIEKKKTMYDGRLKALLPFGVFFDRSKLTIDSTEDDFEQIIMDAKTGRTAYLKEQEKIKAENIRLQNEAIERQAEDRRIEKLWKGRLSELINPIWNGESAIDPETEEVIISHDDIIKIDDEAFEKIKIAWNKKATDRKIEKQKKIEDDKIAKEESKRKAADELKAKNAPDKEKLEAIIEYLNGKKISLTTDNAINAVSNAITILLKSQAKL